MPERRCSAGSAWWCLSVVLLGWSSAAPALAQSALRDLSDFEGLGQTFTVSINVTPPAGTIAFGVEDSPPNGWSDVTAIDNGGSWDAVNNKVKWGPFFNDQPVTLHYDLTPPGSGGSQPCFFGTVSIDGSNQAVQGDICLPRPVPAASEWALLSFALLLLIAGTSVVRRCGRVSATC